MPKNVKKIINKKGHVYSETLNNWKHYVGKDVTGEDLQILLGQIIQNEDKSNPLSDENLKFALKDNFGVILSRRTIAKYRLELEIPSSRERYLL